ncbi:MAG: hypothetical protein HY866_04420 [Chloroflexi bacterium]|nr:hypothetical protein [Chloroflexota bacterium]
MSYAKPHPDAERWAERLARWSHRWHMASGIGLLLDLLEPLGPLGAQVLWIAQPTLALFVPRDEVASLAQLIEAPGGVAWLREQLVEPDSEPVQTVPEKEDEA